MTSLCGGHAESWLFSILTLEYRTVTGLDTKGESPYAVRLAIELQGCNERVCLRSLVLSIQTKQKLNLASTNSIRESQYYTLLLLVCKCT